MSFIRTNAAAAMLGVSPNTLRSWEQRFGYPSPQRTEGGHRQFDLIEIQALRQAFEETQNISTAISLARERGEGPSSPSRLRSALSEFDEQLVDRLL
ncbi:MAG: MerR family transcriptional regulator, partial [Solirubrobacteraceae bacterium]